MRVNVGAGGYHLRGFVNLDADPRTGPDVLASVPPLPFEDGDCSEVWACHFLEHLTPDEATEFLRECWRVLRPGGKLGIVVPDTRAVVQRYLAGEGRVQYPEGTWREMADLDEVCRMFFYSSVQDSPHRWSYDLATLRRVIERAGFKVTGQIDRWRDQRIAVGAWYQCGLDAVKPEVG